MKELQQVVNNKMQSMISDGAIEKLVQDGVEQAIATAISSQFKSYGSITMQIEESIEKGLRIKTEDLPFETYNEQMLVIIKTKLGKMFQGQAAERFLGEIDKTLAPAPKEMPISEFVETVVSFWKTDEPWDADNLDDYATVEAEPWRGDPKDITLKMWKQKENTYSRSCSADLDLFILGGQVRLSHNQSYNPTSFSEHESFVFKLYAAGTILTGIEDFDPDDCDLTLKEDDY